MINKLAAGFILSMTLLFSSAPAEEIKSENRVQVITVEEESGKRHILDLSEGPIDVQVRQAVRLTVMIEADVYLWFALPPLTAIRSGNVCTVYGPEGKYDVQCTVVRLVGTDPPKFEQSDLAVKVIIGKPPTPPPVPPDPDPDLPDGKYKLAASSYAWAGDVPESHRSEAAALSQAFQATAAAISAGGIKTLQELQQKSREANNAACTREVWLDPFFLPLSKRLKELAEAGQMVSLDDHATAWREISLGLSKVK